MNSFSPFFTADRPYEQVLPWLKQRLSEAGLRVMPTFDLATARTGLGLDDCPCPNHGTQECDCEMIVLLVYKKSDGPATLILHGNNEQCWISLVNNAQQHPHPGVRSPIEQALQINPAR